MSVRIQFDTVLDAASDNNIATNQTPGAAGNLTLNGVNVSGGIATTDSHGNARQILFTSAGDESGKTITVTGRLSATGGLVSETVTGPNTTATTVNYFVTVTQIAVSAAFGGNVKAGTNGVGASPWKAFDRKANPGNAGLATLLKTGAANWTVEVTYHDIFDPAVIPVPLSQATIAAKSSSIDAAQTWPVAALRLKINSGTGTVTTIVLQGTTTG